MATHKVSTGGGTRARASRPRVVKTSGGGTASDERAEPTQGDTKRIELSETPIRGRDQDDNETEDVILGLEHKVPLSEAVLRATGLFGGVVPDEDPDDVDEGTRASFETARSMHRAAGFDDTEGVMRDLRDQPGAVFLPPPSREECIELQQVVRFLEAEYKGIVEWTPAIKKVKGKAAKHTIVVRLTYGDGEVVSGTGKNRRAALEALCAKLDETFPAFARESFDAAIESVEG